MYKCPNGTRYDPAIEDCLGKFTPEQALLCIVAGIGIFVFVKLISNRNRQRN